MAQVLYAIAENKKINLTHVVEIAPAHNKKEVVVHLMNGHKHFVSPAVAEDLERAIEAFYA